jgi:hypothetical protein
MSRNLLWTIVLATGNCSRLVTLTELGQLSGELDVHVSVKSNEYAVSFGARMNPRRPFF